MTAEYLVEFWNRYKIYLRDIKHLDYSHLSSEIQIPRQIIWHLYHELNEPPKCQNENCQKSVIWKNNRKPIEIGQYTRFCSVKCGNRSEMKKERTKQIWLKKYGVDHPWKNKIIQEKRNQTWLEKYQKHPAQSKEIREKIKQTNLERYGVEYPFQSNEIHEKISQINLERYGVKNPAQLEKFQEKARQTRFETYGVEHHMQSKELKEKYKTEYFEKHGVFHTKQIRFSKEVRNLLFDSFSFSEFIRDKTVTQAARLLKVDSSTIHSYIERHNIIEYVQNKSYLENEMKVILEEIGINFIQNTRKIIAPLELDFYLPDHQVAIEMNGDYWHSDEKLLERTGMTADEYHQMKFDRCYE